MHGRTPKVSHIHVFGCKCFILKKGKKLDKFAARSVDGWCWFVLREEYCWLVVGGWFVLRENYCWLVADKPSEQAGCAEVQDGGFQGYDDADEYDYNS
jgi:hypothetical protein